MPATLHHILVIRFSSIGDVILTTPMLRVLKAQFPDCVLHVAVRREFSELLQRNPHIDRLITIDTSLGNPSLRAQNLELTGEGYDAVFDLQNNFRSRVFRNGLSRNLHIVNKRQWKRLLLVKLGMNHFRSITPVAERYIDTAAQYGLRPDAQGPELHLDEHVRSSARLKLRAAGAADDTRLVGICPGARHFTKRWPEYRFEELTRALLDRGHTVAVFGGSEEWDIADRLRAMQPGSIHNCCGKLTLMETAAAMQHCATLFVNDSGLMHMATAMGVPVVAVFGSTVQEFGFFPYHSRSVVAETAGLPCRPCTHIGRADCPKGHLACLRLITADDVLRASDLLASANEKGT